MDRYIQTVLSTMEKREGIFSAAADPVDQLFESESINLYGNARESVVDSRNVSRRVAKCMKILVKSGTSWVGKIKIANFLCNLLYDVIKLSTERKQVITDELTCAIYSGVDLLIPIRLWYLRFRNHEISYNTSIMLFNQGIDRVIPTIPYFQILKYILRSPIGAEIDIARVLDRFEAIFADQDVSIFIKMEIADIFLLNGRQERGMEMVRVVRELEDRVGIQHENEFNVADAIIYNRVKTVYADSQNVHDHDINQSVLAACVKLMETHQPSDIDMDHVKQVLHEVAPGEVTGINTVLERILIDTAQFSHEHNLFSLYNMFSSLWAFIHGHSNRAELLLLLVEEMIAMYKYCSSGHLSRFMNVIQGYCPESMAIRISDKQQVYAILVHHFDKTLSANPEIMEYILGCDQGPFYKFVTDTVNAKLPELIEEYKSGNIVEHALLAVKKYTKSDAFDIIDGTIVYTLEEIYPENIIKKEDVIEIEESKIVEEIVGDRDYKKDKCTECLDQDIEEHHDDLDGVSVKTEDVDRSAGNFIFQTINNVVGYLFNRS